MAGNYKILIDKINEFKQKFYLNKLLRGLIYTATTLLALYLILFVSVYYARPDVTTKTVLFLFFIVVVVVSATYWLVIPGLAYFKLGKSISTEDAASFIGNHFSSIQDKLLNTLQLQSLANLSPENSALILAGIDQKITELRPIPFTNAISLKDNRKYIKFFLIPFVIIVLIGLIAPSILKEGSYSFIKFNKEILPVAPFDFVLNNKTLTVTQGDDLTLQLKLTGDQIPQDVYLEDGQNNYKLEKKDISNFQHTLKNLQKSKKIRFSGGGFNSASYTIDVKPRPSVLNMNATLHFPSYLGKQPEEVTNAGDLLIPEGTKVTWRLNSENSNHLRFFIGNTVKALDVNDNVSVFSTVVRDNTGYKIIAQNAFVSNNDSISHQISVIKDQFPTISVQEVPDSLSSKALYFSGNVADDHGFTSLFFCYNILEGGKKTRGYKQQIQIKNNQVENSYFYTWDLKSAQIKQGETVEYYFEVADNDGVNGPKKSKSTVAVMQAPTPQQIAEQINSGSEQLKDKMEKAIKLAAAVEKESKKLNETILDKKQLTYEDKKQVEQLLDKQKQLEDAVKDIKALNEKNNINKEENTQMNDELMEKQKQINDLFNNVLDEKTKEILKNFEKMIQENSKDQTQDDLSKMQMDNKSLKNELDRILELYKQLEFEQALKNNTDRLKELARQEKELAQEAKDKPQDAAEQLKDKQEQLSKEFNDIKKEMDKLEEKDKSLQRPNGFQSPDKESQEIQQQQKDAENALQQKNNKKAAEKQEDAADKMDKLAKKIEDMQKQNEEEENEVNAAELRKLLENLLNTSFDQEKTMLALRRMQPSDPLYITNVQKQRSIKDNMSTIADSLFALSKRVPQIESTVTDEMSKINFNIEKSLDNLGERRTSEANKFQQYTMTSVNNLALMLNEALEQLQQQKKGGSSGKSKKKGMKQLQDMQDQLNKNMQKAKQQMQQQGNQGTVPKGQMSEQFAKMAQQQQMIREALQKINQEDNKDGKGGLGNLNQVIKDMKQTESDLVNKRIEQETLNRQKNVLTKLLDADKAQREQDQDAKREAKEAKQFPPSYKQMLEKFNKAQQNETELLQKLSPDLNYYYKNKIAEYFKRLNSGQ